MKSQSGIDFLVSLGMAIAVGILVLSSFLHFSINNSGYLSRISNKEISAKAAVSSMLNVTGVFR
jgi:hypothetical protein